MINDIESFMRDEDAVPRKIKELQGLLDTLKAQQAPTINLSGAASIAFGVNAYNRTTNIGSDSSIKIMMTLTPGDNERLFAIPELELYGNTFGAASINVDDEFPTGASWGLGGNSPNFFDLDVWYDLWDNAFQGKQVASAYIRSRGTQGMNCLLITRWRYVTQGAG